MQSKAVATERLKRYTPHFVWAVRLIMNLGEWNGLYSASISEEFLINVETLRGARTKLAVFSTASLFVVVLVLHIQHFLSLLLFHRVMQEHSDKH